MDGAEGAVMDVGVQAGAELDTSSQDIGADQGAQGEITQDVAGSDGSEQNQDATAETDGDGRTLPKDVQAALKALRELNPANGKTVETLRKSYFANQQFAKVFPTPAVAQQAKAALELVGGEQGISGLQERIASAEQVDAGLESGDPAILEDVFKNFSEGIAKLTPHILDRLAQSNPTAYAKSIQPHVYQALESAGLGSAIGEITRLLAANDVNGAKEWLGKTQNWLNGQKQQAGEAKTSQVDPEREKLQRERNEVNQEREQMFRGRIGEATTQHQSSLIEKAIAPNLKASKLSADAKADLVSGINSEIQRRLKANDPYQKQMKAMLGAKTRDPEKIKAYVKAQLDLEVPEAAKTVWARRYGSAAPKAAPRPGEQQRVVTPTGIGSSPQQPIKVPQKPALADRDLSKDPKDLHMLNSRAFMQSGPYKGKWVSWAQ